MGISVVVVIIIAVIVTDAHVSVCMRMHVVNVYSRGNSLHWEFGKRVSKTMRDRLDDSKFLVNQKIACVLVVRICLN